MRPPMGVHDGDGRPDGRPEVEPAAEGAALVVVANRLPVDEVVTDDRPRVAPQPGRSGDGAAPDPGRGGAATGSAGPARPGRRRRRSSSTASGCTRAALARGGRPTTTRVSPTRPSGRSTTTPSRPRSSTGTGARRTAWSTAGSPRRPTGWRPPGRRSGCRTTSSSSSRRCCASAGRTCASGSSCTSRSRRSSCSCSCRSARRSSAGCSGPTWSASRARWPRRTSCTWPTTCSGCGGAGSAWTSTGARSGPAPSRSPSTSTRWSALIATPAVQSRADEVRMELGQPKTLILGVDRLDYTKGIQQRLRAYHELLAEGRLQHARDGAGAGRHPEPGAGGALRPPAGDGRAGGRPHQRRVQPGRRAGRALPAPVLRAGRARRALPGGRRDGGDAAARRHEPGGQGVRGRAR